MPLQEGLYDAALARSVGTGEGYVRDLGPTKRVFEGVRVDAGLVCLISWREIDELWRRFDGVALPPDGRGDTRQLVGRPFGVKTTRIRMSVKDRAGSVKGRRRSVKDRSRVR